jgi:hypothetical protein
MKILTKFFLATTLCAITTSCSTQTSKPLASYPQYQGRVFITEESPPANIEFDMISTIEVGKNWYGSSNNALTSMADRARELGANAIIQSKTWFAPSGFSWAAPHASGQAIHIKDIKVLESAGIKGTWQ